MGEKQAWQCTIVYVVLFPLLIPLGAPSPLTILSNWWLAPILSFGLFPLSLLSIILPPLTFITDTLWETLYWLGPQLDNYFPAPLSPYPLAIPWLWVYLFTVHGVLHLQALNWSSPAP